MKIKIPLYLLLLIPFACKTVAMNEKEFSPVFTPGPPTLVYKTRANYDYLVPVMLSDDKSTVVSYPDPSDIKTSGDFPSPTHLTKGYLLDKRGIGANVAFLKLTYTEYAKLNAPLSLAELYKLIIDKDPLVELCNCGNRSQYTDAVSQLNQLIDNNSLRQKCKIVK